MSYSREEIEKIIGDTLSELYEKDSVIIFKSYNLHERSISHRFALYLEKHFTNQNYIVDVEYNRMLNDYGEDIIGNEIGKRLDFEKYGKEMNAVYPDVIVHKRNTTDNLLEIEIKMQWKNSKKEFDLIKINEYISQLDYQYGVYLELAENRNECQISFGPFEINSTK